MSRRRRTARRHVLRTHTSPVQVRTMLNSKPPIRIISPGRTYRVDSDATHSPMFHQVEALVVDEGIHLGHLKWTVEEFCKAFFEIDKIELRARPSFFPFTEPSLEWDMRCDRSVPGQINFGQGNDWLELGGSGMVHRKVLENCGIDPHRYQGFAFGFGLDRMAMLKYGIPDIRSFFESDLRWLKHYGFAALDIPTLDGGLSQMKFTLSLAERASGHRCRCRRPSPTSSPPSGWKWKASPIAGAALKDFIVGEVVTAEKHPNADKLRLCSVNDGEGHACRSSAARPMRAPASRWCWRGPAP